MLKRLILYSVLLLPVFAKGQEFNCQIQVNAPQIEESDKKVFQTLQQALYEFVNN